MKIWCTRRWSIGLVIFVFIAFVVEICHGRELPSTTSSAIPTSMKFQENSVMTQPKWSIGYALQVYLERTRYGVDRISSDFWERAGRIRDAVLIQAEDILQKAAASNAAAAEQLRKFKAAMNEIISFTAKLRADVEHGVLEHGLSLEDVSEKLSQELAIILKHLEEKFPPPSNATHHEQRRQIFSEALSNVENSLVSTFTPYGISEATIRSRFGDVKIHVEDVLVITGDLVEQHPALLETVLITGAALLIPESWFLRPFLSLFGYGPYGPIKGSLAAWAQRRFWGGAVAEGSWFAFLQRAGMKPGLPGLANRLWAAIGVAIAVVGSFFGCR